MDGVRSFGTDGRCKPQSPADLTIGHLSYAPTTKTTTITTTTTTHTTLPPLILKPAKSLSLLDPKQYPLANVPTPGSIREFSFEVNGIASQFKESAEPHLALKELEANIAELEATGNNSAHVPRDNALNGLKKRAASPLDNIPPRPTACPDSTYRHKRQASKTNNVLVAPQVSGDHVAPQPIRPIVNTDFVSRVPLQSLPDASGTAFPMVDEHETALAPPLSLPSPSLSPVTASLKHKPVHMGLPNIPDFSTSKELGTGQLSGLPSVMGIPSMVDNFASLPPNVQSYVVYQFLRFCNKDTLQVVAKVIEPALKCDFLLHFPPELTMNILRHLDAYSMCQAVQVSRKWKEIIDDADWRWHSLFEESKFDMDEDERYRQRLLDKHPEWQNGHMPTTIDMDESIPQILLHLRHFYRDVFKRHHTIRSSWMRPDVKPRHISFHAHGTNVVTCLQFDDDKIITGSDDNCINVYATRTGRLRRRLEGHEGGVWAFQYIGNTLVSGSTDRTVRIWDIEQGICTQIFQGHSSTVRCLLILPSPTASENGKQEHVIVTGSRDSTLKVWRLPNAGDEPYQPEMDVDEPSSINNPYFLRSLVGHSHSVRAIAGHENTLVSGSYDNTVRVWRISTGECIWRLVGHTQKVYSVVLDTERNRCVSGSMDWTVRVWDLVTGTCLWTLEGHASLVGLLELSSVSLVSAAADSTLRVWDPETGECKHVLSANTGPITCFQQNEHRIVSGSDGMLKMWDARTGRLIKDLLTELSGVWQLRMGEKTLVAAVQRGGQTFIDVLDFDVDPNEQNLGRRVVSTEEDSEMD